MLQVDHVYEFFYENIFQDFSVFYLPGGVPKVGNVTANDIHLFTKELNNPKIFFYDQEPYISSIVDQYKKLNQYDDISATVVSEKSLDLQSIPNLYYFFHGFAALDWYRGYYALNYNKSVCRRYDYDFITFNRIITYDRSYRIYFVSLLKESDLFKNGLISFNVTDHLFDDWKDETANPKSKLSERAKQHAETYLVDVDKLVIDYPEMPGSASASIPRTINRNNVNNDRLNVDAFWHIVTETVFYYDKLHLTEKIFKPIVSKQPFMLLASPGNLAYLRSYGFKTFNGIIDETYDTITDNDKRIEAVVTQLSWYCSLSDKEKTDIIRAVEPIVLHNFHHFYGDFKQIIAQELITNTKTLFQDIGYDDSHINYNNIYHVLTH